MAAHKIVVIDDSGVIRRTVRDMLPEGNFQVLEAKDGTEGWNLIQKERPDLIVLDFILPGLKGWQIHAAMQLQPDLRKIPLVIMSGRKEEVTAKITEPFEYFAFIEKPFDKKELLDAIKEAMRKVKLLPDLQTAPPTVNKESTPAISTGGNAEIQQLNQRITKMQAEIDALKQQLAPMAKMNSDIENLKKQISQIMNFIKQKLK